MAAQNASIYVALLIPLRRSPEKIKVGLLSGVIQGNPNNLNAGHTVGCQETSVS